MKQTGELHEKTNPETMVTTDGILHLWNQQILKINHSLLLLNVCAQIKDNIEEVGIYIILTSKLHEKSQPNKIVIKS